MADMDTWQTPGYLEEIDGTLHVDGISVPELARRHGTPLFIFSEERILRNIEQIRCIFQLSPKLHTRVFYASKANSNLGILGVIRSSGIDIEVNSGGELYKALKVGFRPDQIIFNGVAKTRRELRDAIEHEIHSINVDSAYELDRILEVAQQVDKRANIALRIVPEVETGAHGGLETGTQDSKFGIAQDRLLEIYLKALDHPNLVSLLGLHMHIGAQVTDPEKFRAGFRALLRTAAELYARTGHQLQHLNIGGGWPISFIKSGDAYLSKEIISDTHHILGDVYGMLRATVSLEEIARSTLGQLSNAEFIGELAAISPRFVDHLDQISIFMEPGTRIVGDTGILVTEVQNHKTRHDRRDTWLLLDAGFNTLLDIFAYNWYFHAISANHPNSGPNHPYKLAGPLCDSGDIYHDSDGLARLPEYRMLPDGLGPGDLIAFLDAGGYTLEQMNQYNGQPRAGAVLVRQDGSVQVIRQRETYDDLVRLDVPLQDN